MDWGAILIGVAVIAGSGILAMILEFIKNKKIGEWKTFFVGVLIATLVELLIIVGTIFLTKGIEKDDDIEKPTFYPLHPGHSVTPSPPINAIPATPSPSIQESSPPPAIDPVIVPKSSPIPTPNHTFSSLETSSAQPEPEPTPAIPVIDISDIPPTPAKTDDPPPPETDTSEPILPPYEPEEPETPESISGVITTITYLSDGIIITVEDGDGNETSVTADDSMMIYREDSLEYIGTKDVRTGWDCRISFNQEGNPETITVNFPYYEGCIEEISLLNTTPPCVRLKIRVADGSTEIRIAYADTADFTNANMIGKTCVFTFGANRIINNILIID